MKTATFLATYIPSILLLEVCMTSAFPVAIRFNGQGSRMVVDRPCWPASCEQHLHNGRRRPRSKQNGSNFALGINFGGWFSGKNEEVNSFDGRVATGGDGEEEESKVATTASLGGPLANVMDTFENFKKSQRIGKATSSLQNELASTTVEASVEDGKVRVTFDCQQRPLRVDIDEAYFDSADSGSDVANAVTRALRLAHSKSIERMDEKMKNFFNNELGLPQR